MMAYAFKHCLVNSADETPEWLAKLFWFYLDQLLACKVVLMEYIKRF